MPPGANGLRLRRTIGGHDDYLTPTPTPLQRTRSASLKTATPHLLYCANPACYVF